MTAKAKTAAALLALTFVLICPPAFSAEKNGGLEKYLAGLALEFSPEGRPDYQGAWAHYQAAAEAGSREALLALARLSDPAGPLKGRPEVWRGHLKKAAEAGWPEAAYELARAIESGSAAAAGLSPAPDYYFQAALGGHPRAAARLGEMYLEGAAGLPRDEGQGAVWLAVAAEKNEPSAALALGRLYYESKPEAAKLWLEKAGLPESYYLLGRLNFNEGRIVEALNYLTVAADRAYAPAHLSLGLLNLDNNHGLKANPREALKHFKAAAQAGLPEAAYQLAKMYLAGQATPKDSITGAFWLHQAAEGGHEAARDEFEKLTLNFTVGQTRRLERMIAEGQAPTAKLPVQ